MSFAFGFLCGIWFCMIVAFGLALLKNFAGERIRAGLSDPQPSHVHIIDITDDEGEAHEPVA